VLRSHARDLLAVAKAAAGNPYHHQRAAVALQFAESVLTDHHGSDVGIACQMGAPWTTKGSGQAKGKGKGQGKETYDQKTNRLQMEFDYLQQVCAGHLSSGEWWQGGKDGKSKGTDFGKGRKGKGKDARDPRGQPPKELRARSRSQSHDRPKGVRKRSKSRDRSNSTGTKGRSRSLTNKKKEKEKAKEEQSAKTKEQRDAANAARPTQLCPACYHEGTYASSKKCRSCKVPFASPSDATTVAPNPAQPTPTPSPVGAAAVQALQLFCKAQDWANGVPSFAEVTKKAPPPPPPPPLPPTPPAPPAPAHTSLAAGDAEKVAQAAKQLSALRTERAAAVAQRAVFSTTPAIVATFTAHLAALDAQIAKILEERQQALEPHQLGLVIGQRQLELSAAMKATADAKEAAKARAVAFDDYAAKVNADFTANVAALVEAQKNAAEGLTAERTR